MEKFKLLIASDKETAEMLLYGYIHGDISMIVVNQIQEAKKQGYKQINLRINSKGGDPFEGLAIYNAIKRSGLQVHAYIDGLAASAASVIPMACDKVYMSRNAKLMIHQAKFCGEGQSDDLKRMSEIMDQINQEMAEIYAAKTGKPVDWINETWMSHGKDMWFSAKEAKAAGLVDEIVEGVVKAHTGSDLMKLAASYEEELEKNFTTKNKPNMNLKAIMTAIMAIKLDGAPVVAMSGNLSDDDQAIGEIQNAVTELGAKVIDLNAELTQAKTKINEKDTELEQLKKDAIKDKATSLVELALGQGKITEGEKESYITLASSNYEETKKILDAKQEHVPASKRINQEGKTPGEDLLKLSYDEADEQNKLERIKADHPDHFKALYKEKFNTDYKG